MRYCDRCKKPEGNKYLTGLELCFDSDDYVARQTIYLCEDCCQEFKTELQKLYNKMTSNKSDS